MKIIQANQVNPKMFTWHAEKVGWGSGILGFIKLRGTLRNVEIINLC